MKTIIITGPSGSGKSNLTDKLSKLFEDTIVIKTDSYYSDNILIRILSIFKYDIYDRTISIKKSEIDNTLNSIYKKDSLITYYNYDFKRKQSSKSKVQISYNGENQFLILEGIFSHRLDLNYQETINILCDEKKDICYKRRIKRDKLERARNSREVNKKFNMSWYLFHQNIKNYLNNNKVITLSPSDEFSYEKLVNNLHNIKNN